MSNICVNHVIYVDEICLMPPSPAALRKLMTICYDFTLQSHFVWCLNFDCINFCVLRLYEHGEACFTDSIKYLSFTFSSDKKDDNDMLQQMRILYTKSNRLLWLFHCCSTDVKLTLFRSYCANCFYCQFLWTHYKKSTHNKLRVAFNNVYCCILKLPPRSSASTMYAVNHIDSFGILVRKRVVGFTERLKVSKNLIISCIDNS